jgi:hypothetical protein
MNAVISAATCYSADQVRCFLESIHRHCPDTVVYLMVFDEDYPGLQVLRSVYPRLRFIRLPKRKPFPRAARLQRSFARAISTIDPFRLPLRRLFSEYYLHISLGRYFVAHDLVRAHRGEFDHVLLADCRDVVLQSDPFTSIGDDVLTGTEEQLIGNCPFNSKWIGRVFGADVLRDLADKPIVCSGVSLGPTEAVQRYLTAMCTTIWRHLPIVMMDNGYDQGVHEYLVHEHVVSAVMTSSREGVIATLGYEMPEHIVAEHASGRIRVRGTYPHIVHQYDRHPALVPFVEQVYGRAGDHAESPAQA